MDLGWSVLCYDEGRHSEEDEQLGRCPLGEARETWC